MHDLSCSLPLSAPSARQRAPARAWRRLLVTLGLALAPAPALAAGGAFVVDDAEVGKAGECKVESWVSVATNHDMAAITQPACVVNFGAPVELGGAVGRFRSGDEWTTTGGPKAKVNILPIATGRVGLALAGAASWDFSTGQYQGQILYVPLTYQVNDDFRINLNAGWQYDAPTKLSYAYWGAAFEWTFMKPLTLVGEVFGLYGNLPPFEDDEAPSSRSIRQPRAQIGLRLTPVDSVDLDLIYGHNISGENAHWLTVGVNLRF